MLIVFYIFAGILIYFSFRSLLNARKWLAYFRRELEKNAAEPSEFISIIAPCKGIDEGLKENLAALFYQDVKNYEVVFVTDSGRDESVPVIEELIATTAANRNIPAKLVIAPRAENSSQKVENLREAVLHLDPRCGIIVFVDSDARPEKHWLRVLAAPLTDENIGAATGYRWFISPVYSAASEIRAAWNASVASVLGPDSHKNFCWGGSVAVRRDVFEKLSIRERWAGTVSDDYILYKVLHDAGLPIHFVPAALTASVETCSFREMLEFTTRQIKLTRVYRPELWLNSLIGSAMFSLTMLAALIVFLTQRPGTFAFVAAAATLLLVFVFDAGKILIRLKAARLALPLYSPQIADQMISQILFWPVVPLVFLYNSIAAVFSRTIRWRGFEYKMVSPFETRVTKRESDNPLGLE